MSQTLEKRGSFSNERISELRKKLSKSGAFTELEEKLTCYVVGSIGRLEASKESDLDIFFVYNNSDERPEEDTNPTNIQRIRLLSDFIKINDDLGFEKPSRDGEFLKIIHLSDILKNFGGPSDDYQNLFTARMLLILESKCLFSDGVYDSILDHILKRYFRDWNNHQNTFKPTMILNDIIRYWKTLCLNFENDRIQADRDNSEFNLQKKLNKLKYSRLLTCFATVIAICSKQDISEEFMKEICKKPPLERIKYAIDNLESNSKKKELELKYNQIIDLYKNFLDDPESYAVRDNAEKFSEILCKILYSVTDDETLKRQLLL